MAKGLGRGGGYQPSRCQQAHTLLYDGKNATRTSKAHSSPADLASLDWPERTERSCRKPCIAVVRRMNPRWIERPLKRGASAARVTLVFLRVVYRGKEPEAAPKIGPKEVFWKPWLMTVCLLVILWVLDPVDVATNSARASAELFYRVVSPNYHQPTSKDKIGSSNPLDDNSKIAVIVINDETLRRKGAPWPPPFSVHAEVIEKVLLYNPKALFINFGFFDARGQKNLDALIEVLSDAYRKVPPGTHKACDSGIFKSKECEGADWRVPVFLAGAPRSLGPRKALYQLGVIPQLQDTVTGTVSTRYSTEHELRYNSYPLFDCFTGEPSAALAMYAAGYDDWITWGLDLTPCPLPAQREERDRKGGPNKLSVYWASWGDATSSRGSYECKTLPEGLFGRMFKVVWIWVRGLFQDDKAWREQFQACPPHRSYAAHAFLADDRPELAEFMDDRYVFYGGNFAMADDLITPPTHEPVPGVFLHAMALDNLLRFRGEYVRVEGESGIFAVTTWLTLAVIAFAGFCTVMAWNGYEALTKRPARPRIGDTSFGPDPYRSKAEIIWDRLRPIGSQFIGGGWVLTFLLLSVAGTFFALWIGFSVLNFAPINFIGILSFVGIHTIVRSGREILHGVLGGG